MDADEEIDQKDLPGRLGALVALEKSRENHPYDKPSADFIQRYAIAAIRCFENNENPTMALMALRPFKVGRFNLATELQTLLFDNGQPVEKTLEDFKARLGDILSSIQSADREADSPYLIQDAIGLQMLVCAALTRADKTGIDIRKFESDLNSKIEGIISRIMYPAWKLLFPLHNMTMASPRRITYQPLSRRLLYQPEPEAKVPSSDTGPAISNPSVSSMPDMSQGFVAAAGLARQSQFDEALAQIELTLQLVKQSAPAVNFLYNYFHRIPNYRSLNEILDWLVKSSASSDQRTFALKALNRILLLNNDQAPALFRQGTDSALFKALLAFTPQTPEATLELGKLFRILAGQRLTYHPKFRAVFESNSNRNKFIASAGTLFIFAIVATAISIIFFPLLPLYAVTFGILAGILGLGALATLGGAFFSKKLPSVQTIPGKPESSRPMMQTNLKTWLEIYGYDPHKLQGKELFDVFERTPALANSIDIVNDATVDLVCKSILMSGDWTTFERLINMFPPEARLKLPQIVVELGETCFRSVVTNLGQLQTFCSYLPSADQEKNVGVLWGYISTKPEYLKIFSNRLSKIIQAYSDADDKGIPSGQKLYYRLTAKIKAETGRQQRNPSPQSQSPFAPPTQTSAGSDSIGQDSNPSKGPRIH